MKKIQKQLITVSCLKFDKDTCDFICEKVNFVGLEKHKFPNFLRELAYFRRHLKDLGVRAKSRY